MSTGKYTMKVQRDKQLRTLTEIILPRLPEVGEHFIKVGVDGKPEKKYKVIELNTFLWPSGDLLVIEDKSTSDRLSGEIILEEVAV